MELQDEMQKAIGKAKRAFTPPVVDEALYQKISDLVTEGFKEAYGIAEKARPLRQAQGRPGEGHREPSARTTPSLKAPSSSTSSRRSTAAS